MTVVLEEVMIRNVNVPYVSHYQYLRPVCLDFSTIHSYFSILYVILYSILLKSPCIVCVSNHTHFSVFSTLNFISIEGLISINKTDKSV